MNTRLRKVRERHYPSLNQASRELGIDISLLWHYENGTLDPWTKAGEWRESALKLAIGLNTPLDQIWETDPPVPLYRADGRTPIETSSCEDYIVGKEILSQCWERLSQKCRKVLLLVYQKGMSYQEIGEVMGLTKARVGQLHQEAMETFRIHMLRN